MSLATLDVNSPAVLNGADLKIKTLTDRTDGQKRNSKDSPLLRTQVPPFSHVPPLRHTSTVAPFAPERLNISLSKVKM